MKKQLPLILLIILASCGEKGSSESTQPSDFNFTVEIDTVQVDPGADHFIYLGNYLNTTALSSDKKMLYNFNGTVPELEVIDLDELSLSEVIPLENEGPTGIGAVNSYMPMMDISDSGELFLNTWNYLLKLNAARDQVSKYWFTTDSLKGDPISETEKIYPEGKISDDGKFFYSSYGLQDIKKAKSGLVSINLQTMELKKVPMDIYEKIDKFSIVFSPDGNGRMSIAETVFLMPFEDRILVSSTAFNEVYVVSLPEGTVEKKSFHSALTDDAKKGNYEKNAGSQVELFELNKEKVKEVRFNKLHFDDQNQKFWRFSSALDRMIGDSAVYKSVLTIFDKNLTQLHEQKVDYSETGSLTFFKDGTLYSFINLEDELAFVRITPNYE